LGEVVEGSNEKPQFASLQKGQSIETISMEEALKLFGLPRDLGEFEDKKVVVGIGRFGPYIRHDSGFVSLKSGIDDPLTVTIERAIELIEEKREQTAKAVLKTFREDPDIKVLQGRWGPYISYQKGNYKIKKGTNIEKLTFEDCKSIIEAEGGNSKTSKRKTK
jgi:DNA topoisomerase-1